ncbi:MAG: RND family efflux transporter MFP subunit [Pseudomonadales bacterium]|jgi:RND family efflux transporter MFP subunit
MKLSPLRLKQIAVLAIGMAVVMFFKYGKPAPEEVDIVAINAPAIDVLQISPGPIVMTVHTQGTVKPWLEIDVLSQVSGEVKEVAGSFSEGGFFSKGDSLVRVDELNYQTALLRARAKLADAEQLLAVEKGRALQAKREWRNLQDENANALFLRKPQLQSAEAQVAAAKGDVASANLDLEYTNINLPFAGRLKSTHVNLGQFVSNGMKVASVFSTEKVEVRLPLSDNQVSLLDLPINHGNKSLVDGVPVLLNGVFSGQTWQWEGVIKRTSAVIDDRSRFFYAVAEVYEPFKQVDAKPPLNIGQFVRAEIRGRIVDNAMILPRRALRAGNSIWVVDKFNKLRATKVNVLQSLDDQVTVQLNSESDVLNIAISSVAGLNEGFEVIPLAQGSLGEAL